MIVVLAAEAVRDLEAIGDHIARDDPARALSFVQALREKCLGLADMPERFPLVPRYEAAAIRVRRGCQLLCSCAQPASSEVRILSGIDNTAGLSIANAGRRAFLDHACQRLDGAAVLAG